MANILSQITIETTAAGEKACADLGLTAPHLQDRNGQAALFTVKHAGAGFDAAPLFAYDEQIVVRIARSRTSASAAWAGGRIVFVGKRVNATASLESKVDDYDYIFANVWHELERLVFGQKWRTKFIGGSAYEETSEVMCPTYVDELTNVVSHITNGAQIQEVITWAIDHGINIQHGNVTPDMLLPVDAFIDQSCVMVIQKMLKLCPDSVCWIDMTTEDGVGNPKPTFNCVQHQHMTEVVWQLDDEIISSLSIQRRDDLVVPAVVLKYKRTDQVDGRTVNSPPFVDKYPADKTGFEVGALMQCIRLFGARVRNMQATIDGEVAPTLADLATGAWWEEHGGLIGNYVPGSVTITPDPLPTDLPYILFDSPLADWITDEFGNPAEVEHVTYTALVSFTDTNGSVIKNKKLSQRLRATNIAPGDYSDQIVEEIPEYAAAGLAQKMFNTLSVIHHDGQVTVTQAECDDDLTLINTLSIAGGTGRYAAMRAVVQAISMDLTFGTRTVTFGWPKHLSIDDIIEIGRWNRTRMVDFSPDIRGSGDLNDDGGTSSLPEHTPRENSANGSDQHEVFVAKQTNVVKLDGTNGSLDIRHPTNASLGSISALLSEALGQEIKLRKIAESVKDTTAGSPTFGQCLTRYRIYLCGPQTTS